MARTLYLHIGAHKTGTSAIQVACLHGRKALRQRGWDLAMVPGGAPNWGFAFDFDHSEAQTGFSVRPHALEKMRNRLANGPETMIFTVEDLFFLDGDAITAFADAISDLFDRIEIIAYLRRQDELAASQKAQGAKTIQSAWLFGPEPTPLPELTPAVRAYFDFDAKLAAWQAALPKAHLTVREYRRNALVDGDIVADFSQILGIPLENQHGEVNTTFGANSIRLMYELRRVGVDQPLIRRIVSHDWVEPDQNKFLPTRDEAQAFFDSFAESNAALSDRLGGFAFGGDFSRYPEVQSDTGFADYERENLYRILSHANSLVADKTAWRLKDRALEIEASISRFGLDFGLRSSRDRLALALELAETARELDPFPQEIIETAARLRFKSQKPVLPRRVWRRLKRRLRGR